MKDTRRALTFVSIVLLLQCGPARAFCAGDCDEDGWVGIHDLILAVHLTLGSGPLRECRYADSDLDGELQVTDLVAAVRNALNGCPEISLFPQSRRQFNVGFEPTSVAVADLDRDGWLDMVTSNETSNDLTILWGPPARGFEKPESLRTVVSPSNLLIANLNDDAFPDLLVVGAESSELQFSFGEGARTFRQRVVRIADVDGVSASAVADFNEDGLSDIVMSLHRCCPGHVVVLTQTENEEFAKNGVLVVSGSGVRTVTAGDVDGDGFEDVVAAGARDLHIFFGDGAGGFTPARRLPLGSGTMAAASPSWCSSPI